MNLRNVCVCAGVCSRKFCTNANKLRAKCPTIWHSFTIIVSVVMLNARHTRIILLLIAGYFWRTERNDDTSDAECVGDALALENEN